MMEEFDTLYAELLEHEEKLKEVLTGFATGNRVTLREADTHYASIKKTLKKIRKLAEELHHE